MVFVKTIEGPYSKISESALCIVNYTSAKTGCHAMLLDFVGSNATEVPAGDVSLGLCNKPAFLKQNSWPHSAKVTFH
jgi:hypothetical protein